MAARATTSFFNRTRGVFLATRTLVADTFLLRLRGLLFRPPLQQGQGLYLSSCKSIHMFGMDYPIDAVFVDGTGTVVGLVQEIAPGRVSPFFSKAAGCLELPAGTIAETGTEIGDVLEQSP